MSGKEGVFVQVPIFDEVFGFFTGYEYKQPTGETVKQLVNLIKTVERTPIDRINRVIGVEGEDQIRILKNLETMRDLFLAGF